MKMFEEKTKQMRAKQEAAARKKVKERKEKEHLTQEIISMGLWQNTDQVESGLIRFKSKSSKLKALKVQLDFLKKILEQSHPSKTIFQLSHQGKKYTVEEMTHKLCQLLPASCQSKRHASCPVDLSGKRIQHRWIVDGENEWFTGTIIGKVMNMEASSGMW